MKAVGKMFLRAEKTLEGTSSSGGAVAEKVAYGKGTPEAEKEMLKKLSKQVAKGAGITFVGDFFGKGTNYISQVVIARLLGVEVFGLYALGLVIFNVAQTFATMGLAQGGLRYVSIYQATGDKDKVKGTIIQSLCIPFMLGSIIGLIGFFLADDIARIFNKPTLTNVIKIVSLGIPFMATLMVAAVIPRGFLKTQYFVYSKNIFHPIVNLALVMLFYWLGFYLLGAVSAWIIAAGLGLLLSIYFIGREFPEFTKVKASYNAKELIAFSIPLALAGFIGMFYLQTDILMLSYFRPSNEVGTYNAIAQTVILLSFGLTAFNSIYSPLIANLYHTRKQARLAQLLKIVAKWTFVVTLLPFCISILSLKEILNIFGPEFVVGWKAFLVLLVFKFLSFSLGPVTETLIMSGKQRIELCNTFCALALNIILNFFLIPVLGIIGAALATGISLLTIYVTRLLELYYFFRLWPFSKRYVKGSIAGAVAIMFTFFVKSLIPNVNYLYSLFITTMLVGISFVGTILALKLDEEDKVVISAIRNRMR